MCESHVEVCRSLSSIPGSRDSLHRIESEERKCREDHASSIATVRCDSFQPQDWACLSSNPQDCCAPSRQDTISPARGNDLYRANYTNAKSKDETFRERLARQAGAWRSSRRIFDMYRHFSLMTEPIERPSTTVYGGGYREKKYVGSDGGGETFPHQLRLNSHFFNGDSVPFLSLSRRSTDREPILCTELDECPSRPGSVSRAHSCPPSGSRRSRHVRRLDEGSRR